MSLSHRNPSALPIGWLHAVALSSRQRHGESLRARAALTQPPVSPLLAASFIRALGQAQVLGAGIARLGRLWCRLCPPGTYCLVGRPKLIWPLTSVDREAGPGRMGTGHITQSRKHGASLGNGHLSKTRRKSGCQLGWRWECFLSILRAPEELPLLM